MRRLVVVLVVIASAAVPATALAEPFVSRTCNGSSNCNVWFTSPVSLRWTYAGTVTSGCQNETLTQDTAGTLRACFVSDAGETASKSVTIQLDQTPPSVTDAVADRPPDHDGWYSHPVTFAPKAADATSGVLACESVTYGGPDTADARIVATCKDKAGLSASRTFPLRYDATSPDLGPANLTTGDKVVRLSWPAGSTAVLTRSPGTEGGQSALLYDGPGTGFTDRKVRNGRKYRYVLTLTDQAGNSASRQLAARPDRHLVAPAKRAAVGGPALLKWTPVRGARYYNVQLFRDGKKILSKWPGQAALQLKSKWRFHGKRYRLKPAEYRWYVWPGEGPRSENRYGRMVGKRSFTIAPA